MASRATIPTWTFIMESLAMNKLILLSTEKPSWIEAFGAAKKPADQLETFIRLATTTALRKIRRHYQKASVILLMSLLGISHLSVGAQVQDGHLQAARDYMQSRHW